MDSDEVGTRMKDGPPPLCGGSPPSAHSPLWSALGWSGIPGGAGEGHGLMAVPVFGSETRTVSAEQWPAHHAQPTLLPLLGDTVCTPTGGQNVGEMWSVSVVSQRKQDGERPTDAFLLNPPFLSTAC